MFSPWPMLRVTGRLLGVGLATSNSLRSMGMGESQPRGREVAGDRLFSCCQWGKNKELIEFLWSLACPLPEGDRGALASSNKTSKPSQLSWQEPHHLHFIAGASQKCLVGHG